MDLSTGEFRATEFQGADAARRVQEELSQLRPKELLYASAAPLFEGSATAAEDPVGEAGRPDSAMRSGTQFVAPAVVPRRRWTIGFLPPTMPSRCSENHFGVLSLEGFGLAGKPAAASAAGAILHYVRSTQRGTLDHVDRIGFYERQNCLVLDAVTVRNLELIEPLFAGTDAGVTLFRAMDATVTPMGKRLLRAWMLRPSMDRAEIEARLDAVEARSKKRSRGRSCGARWKECLTWNDC